MSTSLEELRAQVLQSATSSIALPPVLTDLEERRLLLRQLDALRYRIDKKEITLKALETQVVALRKEQQTTCPPEHFFKTQQSLSLTLDDKGEFSVLRLWQQRQNLQAELEGMQGKLDAEDLQTEQMSYLLQTSKQAAKAACLRTEQLRYLQKRLLRRHDDIVTMHARAENECIHASYSAAKSSQSAAMHSARLQASLSHKRKIADSLKSDVEQLSDLVARKQLQHQEAQIRTNRAAALLARVDADHKEAVAMQTANSLSVEHSENAMKQIEKYVGKTDIRAGSVNEIISAFQVLQFQNMSLNERFSELSEHANYLRLHCDNLQTQLVTLRDSQSSAFALRNSCEFTTFNQMISLLDEEDDQKGLEKHARDVETFELNLVLNCQETMRKLTAYMGFIGAQTNNGQSESFAMVLASQMEGIGDRSPAKGKPKLSHRSRERNSIVALSKEESTTSLARLREELSPLFRTKFVEKVVSAVTDILPVRACPELFTGKDWLSSLEQWTGQEQNRSLALLILRVLVAESNACLQRKVEGVLKSLLQGIQEVTNSRNELKAQIQAQSFTPEQEQAYHKAKIAMRSSVQSIPLAGMPDKQKRIFPLDILGKNKNYSGLRTERSITDRVFEEETSENEEDEVHEKEEMALLTEERRMQRLGLSMREQRKSGDSFVVEKIASLSAIRRVADLEKKLLEQVQGVEVKLKRIKSRERKLRHVPLLPALPRSSSALRLAN